MRRLILLLLLAVPLLAGDRFSYAYSRPSGNATISKGSLEQVLKLRKRYTGEYLWARLDGRQYLIRDASALAEVRRAFVPLQQLEPYERALEAKMKPFEDQEERLESELDDLTDRDEDDDDLTAAEEARVRTLRAELRKLRLDLRAFEAEERELDEKEEALEVVFDAEVERIVKRAIRTGVAERLK
jgi:Skp family chaperone for outer membrane proteins